MGCCVWRRLGRSSRCAALRCARRSKAVAKDRWSAVLRHDSSNANCSRASFPEERQASFGRNWNASSEVFEHFCAGIDVYKRNTKPPLAKTANGAPSYSIPENTPVYGLPDKTRHGPSPASRLRQAILRADFSRSSWIRVW